MSPPVFSPKSFPPLPANQNTRLQMDSINKDLVNIVKGVSESEQVRKNQIEKIQKGQINTENEIIKVKKFAEDLNRNIVSLALKADSANVDMASLYQQVRVLIEKVESKTKENDSLKAELMIHKSELMTQKTEVASLKTEINDLKDVVLKLTSEQATTRFSSGNQNADQLPQNELDLRQIKNRGLNSSISNRSHVYSDPSIVMSGRVAAGHLSRIQAGSGQTFGFNNLPYQVKSESDYYQRIPDLKTSVPGLCVNPPQGRNVTNQNFQAHEDIDALREAEKAWGHTRHLIL